MCRTAIFTESCPLLKYVQGLRTQLLSRLWNMMMMHRLHGGSLILITRQRLGYEGVRLFLETVNPVIDIQKFKLLLPVLKLPNLIHQEALCKPWSQTSFVPKRLILHWAEAEDPAFFHGSSMLSFSPRQGKCGMDDLWSFRLLHDQLPARIWDAGCMRFDFRALSSGSQVPRCMVCPDLTSAYEILGVQRLPKRRVLAQLAG